jgi:hypothetical protein
MRSRSFDDAATSWIFKLPTVSQWSANGQQLLDHRMELDPISWQADAYISDVTQFAKAAAVRHPLA